MYYYCLKIDCHSNYVGIHCDFPHLYLIIGCFDIINEVGELFRRTERGSNIGDLLEHCTELSNILLTI